MAPRKTRPRTADLDDIIRRGGKPLLDLLDHCVRSLQFDFVFVCLVGEYRLHPTLWKALALYDTFCAPQAAARVSALEALPPRRLSLAAAMEPLRRNTQPIHLPSRFLFDDLAGAVESAASGQLRHLRRRYDPDKTPVENLPGGRMTEAQRRFLEKVWQPALRPQLVAAGFRHIATAG